MLGTIARKDANCGALRDLAGLNGSLYAGCGVDFGRRRNRHKEASVMSRLRSDVTEEGRNASSSDALDVLGAHAV